MVVAIAAGLPAVSQLISASLSSAAQPLPSRGGAWRRNSRSARGLASGASPGSRRRPEARRNR